MATIKDVAALAGVSLSTVSIVANGKGGQRNISKATQERVIWAMREVGYRPSIAARKLRGGSERRQLTVFWADDFREIMLARFLRGLHAHIERLQLDVDLGVETYRPGELAHVGALQGAPTFDAAIVANAAPDDLSYLATMAPLAPIVLYNRELPGYPSVVVDDVEVGKSAAAHVVRWLASRETATGPVACLRAPIAFEGMLVREEAFCEAIRAAGHEVVSVPVGENSARGGYEAWGAMPPDAVSCLFAPSDAVAMGVLHRCWERGVRVPDDLGVISVGNGSVEHAEHACPPLTCVSIPMEDMAGQCLELLGAAVGAASVVEGAPEVPAAQGELVAGAAVTAQAGTCVTHRVEAPVCVRCSM